MLWPVVDGKETRYRYAAGHDPYVKKERGRPLLQGQGLRGEGGVLDPPLPSAGRGSPTTEYPFWLTYGTGSGALAQRLDDAGAYLNSCTRPCRTAYVELNHGRMRRSAGDQEAGIAVRVTSRRGELAADGRTGGRPGKAAPRKRSSSHSSMSSQLINLLTLDAIDNISKQPDYKKCAVRIERV